MELRDEASSGHENFIGFLAASTAASTSQNSAGSARRIVAGRSGGGAEVGSRPLVRVGSQVGDGFWHRCFWGYGRCWIGLDAEVLD